MLVKLAIILVVVIAVAQQMKRRGLDQRQGPEVTRMSRCELQRNGAAVRMADDVCGLSQHIEQRGNEIGFDRQVERAIAWPVRRVAIAA